MKELLNEYPVVIEIPVAWGEMDAFQHVNNIVYFRYFENVRVAYMSKINYLEWMTKTGFGPILASTQCRYKFPLTYPDTVLAGAKMIRMEEDRFVMQHAVASLKHHKIAALGEATVVSYNFRENKKAPIPQEIKERIQKLENSRA